MEDRANAANAEELGDESTIHSCSPSLVYPPPEPARAENQERNSQKSRRTCIARAARPQHPHGVHRPEVHKKGEHLPPGYWVISESRRRERRCDASTYLIQELSQSMGTEPSGHVSWRVLMKGWLVATNRSTFISQKPIVARTKNGSARALRLRILAAVGITAVETCYYGLWSEKRALRFKSCTK